MFIESVKATIERYSMIAKGDKVIIGISGGADSVALLHVLNYLKKDMGFSLHLAHLDHMLRKEESLADRKFVEELAGKLDIPVTVEAVDILKHKENRASLEEVARQIRYDFFSRTARDENADKVALGHTLDDQAETVLMRILRGTGLSGLRGIPPIRKMDNCLIIRPLIEQTRQDVLDFLGKRRIRFRRDSSNLEVVFLRNRIRNHLLPALQKGYNPNIKNVLASLAESTSSDYDFLELQAKRYCQELLLQKGRDKITIKFGKLSGLHLSMQRLIIRLLIEDLKGSTRRLTYQHWKEIEDLINNRPCGSIVDLPANISVKKLDKKMVFYLR
jgi:tRNA(Ile)-lysidine synthase